MNDRFSYIINTEYINGEGDKGVKFGIYDKEKHLFYFAECYNGKHEKDCHGQEEVDGEKAFDMMGGNNPIKGGKIHLYDDVNKIKVDTMTGRAINYTIRYFIIQFEGRDLISYTIDIQLSLWGEMLVYNDHYVNVISKSVIGGEMFYVIRDNGKIIFHKKGERDRVKMFLKII